ncbi:MAG: hypothetical protein WAT19_00390 [Ferruginibacter sp.]
MYRFVLGIIIFIAILYSCKSSRVQRQGIISWEKYFENDSFRKHSQIWFYDSSVILNIKNEFSFKAVAAIPVDTLVYETLKFTYLNLKTRRCQDYYDFSDTAKAYCNYTLSEIEGIDGFFQNVSINPQKKIWSDPKPIADTTIDNIVYKRLRSDYISEGVEGVYAEYYLDCSSRKHIFHWNYSVDRLNKDCTATRMEIYSPGRKHVQFFSLTTGKLTKKERKVFKAWIENSKKTNLPLFTLQESMQKCNHLTEGKDSSRLKKYLPGMFKR